MSSLDMQMQTDMAMSQSRKTPNMENMGAANEAIMQKTAKEFEAMYISQMMRPMFEGTEAEEPFGGGQSEKMWKSLQIDEYGKAISNAGGVGIADAVMREMIMLQEASQ